MSLYAPTRLKFIWCAIRVQRGRSWVWFRHGRRSHWAQVQLQRWVCVTPCWFASMFVGCLSVGSMFDADTFMGFMCFTCGLLLHPPQGVFLHQPGLCVRLVPVYHRVLPLDFQERPAAHGPRGLRGSLPLCQELPHLQPHHVLLPKQEFPKDLMSPALQFLGRAERNRRGRWRQRGGREPWSRRHQSPRSKQDPKEEKERLSAQEQPQQWKWRQARVGQRQPPRHQTSAPLLGFHPGPWHRGRPGKGTCPSLHFNTKMNAYVTGKCTFVRFSEQLLSVPCFILFIVFL